MKKTVIALTFVSILALRFEALADGPVCYTLNDAASAPASLPRFLCIETASVDVNSSQIYLYSRAYNALLSGFKLTSLIRATEDSYRFKASNLLSEWNSGCGEGERSELVMDGTTDFNGENADIVISAVSEITNDTCHRGPQTLFFTYARN